MCGSHPFVYKVTYHTHVHCSCVVTCSSLASVQVISKDEVDLPEHVEISPGELDYPPRINFSFYSDSRHDDRIGVSNLNVVGLDRNVCIPITLALPAPPHSPTSRLHWLWVLYAVMMDFH